MTFRLVFSFLTLFAFIAPAQAQLNVASEKSATKKGFTFPAGSPARIILFRPDVQVGEQSTGGLDQPNADWTALARDYVVLALSSVQQTQAHKIISMPELSGKDAIVMTDYRSLFKAVADVAITHKLMPGNELPSKNGVFDWTLGKGAAQLGVIGGGDYGLFLYTKDSYGSSGRKALEIIGLTAGVDTIEGEHMGYAGLIDLKTGDLVWINVNVKMAGDIRTADGAKRRVGQLLRNFPVHASDRSEDSVKEK